MVRLTLNRVHDVRKDPHTGVRRLMGENHYISFRRGDGPTVFVQNGSAFHEGGPEYADHELPDWFMDEAEKVGPEGRSKVGLDRLLQRLRRPADTANGHAVTDPTPGDTQAPEVDDKGCFVADDGTRKYWCADCAEAMPSKKKGYHLMSVHGRGRR